MPELTADDFSAEAEVEIGRPWALAVKIRSSLSMSSRVVRASSSTSAAVRPLVGMGSKTGRVETKVGG